ncbi:MAG: glycerate kinase [Nocardiopsaceae bacterium]|jgi:glycerate kinase|nr:glycerate kinase [Nocardiopsaceae bacterium]
MRVVVAPDKFKGSASAAQVAAALAVGLRRAWPDLDIAEVPVADGGDGTVAAALAAGFAPVRTTAEGPVGEPVETTFGVRQGTAVIEMADVAGLRRLPAGFAPLTASTFGVGQVIRAALGAGASTIVLGIGGSATTDGGAGMVQALGIRLTDEHGDDLGRGGGALTGLAAIDWSGLDPRIGSIAILVASDVNNPLLGPSGAAAVFGPQKGASTADIAVLETGLTRWAALTTAAIGRDVSAERGAGAAGGTGFAALAYLGGQLVPGAELILDLTGFDAALEGADLVITGEGSLDRQTLGGKAPAGVARAAAARGVPVHVVAGRVELTGAELAKAGFSRAYSLADLEPDQAVSMARSAELLAEIGGLIASDLGQNLVGHE